MQTYAQAAAALVATFAKEDAFSGSVLVAQDGQPIFQKCEGFANREWEVPNRECQRFCVSSFCLVLFPVSLSFFSALKKESGRRTGWRTAPWQRSIR